MACVAVVLGAFGAHGIEGRLKTLYGDEVKTVAGHEMPATYKYLRDFNTAAEYHMTHALGLLALGLASGTQPRKIHRISAWCFIGGIVVFSGSLYVLVLTGQRWLGAITPIGGVLMIAAWIAFALSCRPQSSASVAR